MGGGGEISHSFSKMWATFLSFSLFLPASLLWTGQPHLAMNRMNVSTLTNPLFYFTDPNLKITISVCVYAYWRCWQEQERSRGLKAFCACACARIHVCRLAWV